MSKYTNYIYLGFYNCTLFSYERQKNQFSEERFFQLRKHATGTYENSAKKCELVSHTRKYSRIGNVLLGILLYCIIRFVWQGDNSLGVFGVPKVKVLVKKLLLFRLTQKPKQFKIVILKSLWIWQVE